MSKGMIFHFVAQYGYLGILGSMMFGMIGLPIPDELLMTFAGYLVNKGELRYGLTVVVASFGAVCGVTFSYYLGRKWGSRLLVKYGRKIHITPERLEQTERWFNRFGKFAVTISYFIPGVRHLSAFTAGISKWNFRTFLLYAAPGGIIWAASFITLGYYLGEHWRGFTEGLHRYMVWAVLAISAIAGIGLYIRHRRKDSKRTSSVTSFRSHYGMAYEFSKELDETGNNDKNHK